jgi:hypothetical protein
LVGDGAARDDKGFKVTNDGFYLKESDDEEDAPEQ